MTMHTQLPRLSRWLTIYTFFIFFHLLLEISSALSTINPRLQPSSQSPQKTSQPLQLIDPYSTTARTLCTTRLGLSDLQFNQCQEFCDAIVEWNTRINLVSRKDCTEAVIFTRHVLPSLCTASHDETSLLIPPGSSVLDVGTGGGFPGIPLAIQYPDAQFLLLDSVGKKLKAVADIAQHLPNIVGTHHGRVEEMDEHASFDVVTGRAVTALPQFCAWTHPVLKENGRVLYWTGGSSIEEEDLCEEVISVADVLGVHHDDKKILVLSKEAVQQLGAGITVQRSLPQKKKQGRKSKARLKGAWKPKDEPRQRGYENFRRFNSQISSST